MAEPRIRTAQTATPVDMFPGVVRRLLGSGDHLSLVSVDVQAGHQVPEHVHPHEQAGTVIRGRISIRIGDVTSTCGAGDSYLIPGDIPHEVTALETALLIEAFTPVREDFLTAES